jgi:hypothetical protein
MIICLKRCTSKILLEESNHIRIIIFLEKRHRTLTELLFRRSPNAKKMGSSTGVKGAQLEILAGNKGMRYINRKQEEKRAQQVESVKTRNAVYCAIVLEEFVKELAALSQEHALLIDDEEWCER